MNVRSHHVGGPELQPCLWVSPSPPPSFHLNSQIWATRPLGGKLSSVPGAPHTAAPKAAVGRFPAVSSLTRGHRGEALATGPGQEVLLHGGFLLQPWLTVRALTPQPHPPGPGTHSRLPERQQMGRSLSLMKLRKAQLLFAPSGFPALGCGPRWCGARSVPGHRES